MGQYQRLEGLIDNCRAVLQEQLANLSTGKLAELQQWQEACAEMRVLLQQSVKLVKEQGASQADMIRLKSSLAELAGLNKQLFGAAAKQRQVVADRLSRMRKGKSALGGYRIRQQSVNPRFVSSNG